MKKVILSLLILLPSISSYSQTITRNTHAVGLEHNMLFNATKRYKVSQTGNATLDLNTLFNGRFLPSYTSAAPSISSPTVILIEGLPGHHTQTGSWVGWSTRYWQGKRFKIEGYNQYNGSNTWITLADYSNTDYVGSTSFTAKMPSGIFTKLRYTFYEAYGTGGRLGVSELFFLNPEGMTPYQGLLDTPWSKEKTLITTNNHVNIGGTTNRSLWVRHVNGKEGGSTEDDNLYLNYANGKDVWIGGTKNSNLINNGSIRSTGILSLRKSSSAIGDIISLYGDRIGKTSNYGFGVESGVLYSKAVEQHRWYLNKNADNGTSAKMELTNNRLFISDKLGIGTRDTKGYKLAVAGKAIAEEVVVKLKGSWPDYVFKKDYNLPTLKQVEQQIKDQGHLENIPSASEISREGIALGEMNKKLLQKIEELTLYTIDQEKRIEELEKEKVKIKLLEDKLNTLLREVKK